MQAASRYARYIARPIAPAAAMIIGSGILFHIVMMARLAIAIDAVSQSPMACCATRYDVPTSTPTTVTPTPRMKPARRGCLW